MTNKRISDQINTIRVATEKASVSRETALAFLRDAGIISEVNQPSNANHKKGAIAKSEIIAYKRSNESAVSSKTSPVRSPSISAARHTAVKKSK